MYNLQQLSNQTNTFEVWFENKFINIRNNRNIKFDHTYNDNYNEHYYLYDRVF